MLIRQLRQLPENVKYIRRTHTSLTQQPSRWHLLNIRTHVTGSRHTVCNWNWKRAQTNGLIGTDRCVSILVFFCLG